MRRRTPQTQLDWTSPDDMRGEDLLPETRAHPRMARAAPARGRPTRPAAGGGAP
jgi:hypothetical protein